MLYRQPIAERRPVWVRLVADLDRGRAHHKAADLDLLSMSDYLRRDLGLEDGQGGLHLHARRR